MVVFIHLALGKKLVRREWVTFFYFALLFSPRKQNNHFFFPLFSASMLKDGHIIRLINFPKNSRGLIWTKCKYQATKLSSFFMLSVVTKIIKSCRAWTEICNIFFHVHQRSLSKLKNVLLYLSKQTKKKELKPSFSLCHSKVKHFRFLLRFAFPLKDILEFKNYY